MTAKAVFRAVLVVLAVAAALYVLFRLRRVVEAVGISVFIAVALAPAVAWVQRRGVHRRSRFGLPFAVPLAVLMALSALIPLIGSAIGATPIALVAALNSFPAGLIIWVVSFVVYQQIESHVLGPYVYKRTLKLHPLLAIVAVLAGASLLGILGALLAIPIAAMVQILMREYFTLWPARPKPAPAPAKA